MLFLLGFFSCFLSIFCFSLTIVAVSSIHLQLYLLEISFICLLVYHILFLYPKFCGLGCRSEIVWSGITERSGVCILAVLLLFSIFHLFVVTTSPIQTPSTVSVKGLICFFPTVLMPNNQGYWERFIEKPLKILYQTQQAKFQMHWKD